MIIPYGLFSNFVDNLWELICIYEKTYFSIIFIRFGLSSGACLLRAQPASK